MQRCIWARSKAIALGLLLGLLPFAVLAANNNPQPVGPYCYTTTYNSSGAAVKTEWYPCGPSAPVWTLNQAQSTVDITPSDGVTFTPTKAIYSSGTGVGAACIMVVKLVNDTALHTFTSIQPGIVYPFEVIDVENTTTTCTGIRGLY